MTHKYHQPVLLHEVMEGLKVKPGGRYIDATVGDGGHTGEILKRGGIVLGIDRDGEAIKRVSKRLKKEIEEGRLVLMRNNFDKLKDVVKSFAPVSSLAKFTRSPSPFANAQGKPLAPLGVASDGSSLSRKFANFANLAGAKLKDGVFDGILFDLGMSSRQIEESGRGFSFQRDEPLDMRMDKDLAVTAADLVNGLGKKELSSLFLRLGQVERAGVIAEEIVRRRREGAIKTTSELGDLVEKISPRKGRLHPATKVFMALRMAVNDELGSLERALPQAVELLVSGGRLAVTSFHEGEDRIVKRFFRNMSFAPVSSLAKFARSPSPIVPTSVGTPGKPLPRPWVGGGVASDGSSLARKFANFANFDGAKLIEVNKKPIRPGIEEMRANPRARSAKLRIGVRSKE